MASASRDQDRLGHLEGHAVRVEAAGRQGVDHVADQLGRGDLAHGDVDRHLDAVALGVPPGRLGAGLLQHPGADAQDQTVLLEHGDELVGRDDAPCRVPPTQERLDPAHHHGVKLEDGLVEQEELAVRQSRVQVGLEGEAVDGGRLHLGLEQHAAVLAHCLGPVQGHVGVAEQLLGRLAVTRGDADAGGHRDGQALVALEGEGLVEGPPNALGHQEWAVRQGSALGQDHELVSAEAPYGVAGAQHARQACGHRGQQLVPRLVAE